MYLLVIPMILLLTYIVIASRSLGLSARLVGGYYVDTPPFLKYSKKRYSVNSDRARDSNIEAVLRLIPILTPR